MKNKVLVSLLSLALVSTAMVGCGGKKKNSSNPSSIDPSTSTISGGDSTTSLPPASSSSIYDPDDPNSSISPGSIVSPKTIEDALSFNYDNYSIVYAQMYADGQQSEMAYEFYVDGITVMLDYTYAEMYGEIVYDFYASTDEDDYAYWQKADGYEYDGWIANGWRDADLAMYHAYFDLHHLLSALSPNDFETILGLAFIKSESMYKIQECGLEFFGDPFVNTEVITSVSFQFDQKTGAITKILGSVSDTSDDGFEIQISDFGTTTAPQGVKLPKAPYYNSDTDRNIYTYPEMKGDDYVPDVWPESVSLEIVGNCEKEAGYDAVIDIDRSVELAYNILPTTANRIEYDWVISDPEVIDLYHKDNFTPCHRYATGEKEGEATVYLRVRQEDGTYIESNKIKIKVKPLADQDKTSAVYDLTITGSQYKTEMIDGKEVTDTNVTLVSAYNMVETSAEFSIKGHNIEAVEAKNTDSFGTAGMALSVSPSNQLYMNNGFYSEVEFDFGDQEVVSLSFYYALYKSNQRGAAVSNLDEAYIATSDDGVNWSAPISMKEEMLENFENVNLNYLSNKKLMTRTFTKTSHVKLYFKAKMVGNHFQIVMNSFVFSNDSTCHNHGAVADIPVTAIKVTHGETTIKLDGSVQFGYQVEPENATNKRVSWKVSDESKASIDVTGLLTPKAEGKVKVWAEASNGVKSEEIEVTILGQEFLDERYVGNKYMAEDLLVNSQWTNVTLTIVSTTKATLLVSQDTNTTINFTYYTKDKSTRPVHEFHGENGEVLEMQFYDDHAEVFVSNSSVIELGNTHTNNGEELKLYVAATSIKVTHSSKEVTSVELKTGDTYTVYTKVNPTNAYYQDCTATSSNAAVATVTPGEYAGFDIKAVASGTATITFKNADGATGTLTVTVKDPVSVTSITIQAEKTSLEVGQTLNISAVLNPADADVYSLTWSSNKTNVVSVSGNGLNAKLTAKGVGTAEITVTDSKSGKSAKLAITVTASTSTIPTAFLGTWYGMDDVGTEFTMVCSADGTLTINDGSADYTFTYDPSRGTESTLYFICDDDPTIDLIFFNSNGDTAAFETSDFLMVGDLYFFGGSSIYVEK